MAKGFDHGLFGVTNRILNAQKNFRSPAFREGVKILEGLQGGRSPFRNRMQALLCGTAGADTSLGFIENVAQKMKVQDADPHTATFNILDISSGPLDDTEQALRNHPLRDNVHLQCADARHTPFESGSMDLIETDVFLSHFDLDEKAAVIREWKRLVTSEGGIVTRDIVRTGGMLDAACDYIFRELNRRFFGSLYPKITEHEMRQLFTDEDLRVVVTPIRNTRTRLFGGNGAIKHIIASR